MTFWILDTDHISLLQRRHPNVKRHFDYIEPEAIAVTIITVEEQLRGRLNLIRRAANSEQCVQAYTGLLNTVGYFNTLNVLPFDQNAYAIYTELLSQRIRIGTQDLRIAAIALCQKAVLVTRNQRDFILVPNLQLVDWTIEASQ